ncbi:UDP-3-O-(3-hydroxymyristoyl)glucosamine N-acyltransferase [Terriglobus sp. TAA 43]|uniref:UDP-3-O-(3-hydroxymyristoyl)glucosamine N-acyltransferase n=1 Tax=Terriglobus sp. TAA 43 TaxID=278961 RepID=UPI000645D693|nr:UDP-3-O-(3-hydroxymyristoyl)glucosamine N-acyltransferase [Terriglobus sp. TAA 43]
MATIAEIAEWTDGRAASSPFEGEITRVSSLDDADIHAAVFASSPDVLQSALQSRAGVILAAAKIAAESNDNRLVLVTDPRLAFSIIGDRLHPLAATSVHPTAVIDVTAHIGNHTSIGPGVVIGANVRIGNGCLIGARVVIEPGVVIGDRVRIQAGAILGALGFGYARRPDGSYLMFPQQGALVIEDDVEIGANTTIDRGALEETRIGAGTKIDNLVHIGHNCRIGRNVIIAAQTGISGSSVVEDGAILGGQVGMGEHATVGPGVILGGGAGVLSGKKLFGAGQVFWGRPARPLKQYLRDLARLSRGR